MTEAAARFAQSRISCLPVTEKGKIVGLVTKTDLLAADVALAMTAVGAPLCAGDVMTRAPQPVGPDEEVDYAMELMAEMGIRHLPVIDDAGRTVGILDDHDALRAYRGRGRLTHELSEGASEELLVQDVMSKRPISVSLDETCTSIAHLFLQYRATAALVHDSEGTLAGIVSYVDLLKWMIPKATLMGAHPG